MSDYRLYGLPLPEAAQERLTPRVRRELTARGALTEDTGDVTSVSVDPNQHAITGHYRGAYADALASQYEELFGASAIDVVPYYGVSGTTQSDGYYALANVDIPATNPHTDALHRFDGAVRRKGTRSSHYRALKVKGGSDNDDQITNPFGSDTTKYVGIPGRASRVRWFNQDDGTVESATAVTSNAAAPVGTPGAKESVSVTLYDAADASFNSSQPVFYLIYEVAYDHDWRADTRVYDDYDRNKTADADYSGDTVGNATVGSATVGSGGGVEVASTWARVLRGDHEYRGSPVVENGRIRLRPDEDNSVLRAYEWNPSKGIYEITQLGTSDWRLDSFDVRRVGVERVDGVIEMKDTSSTSEYALGWSVKRGYGAVLFYELASESGSTPAGVVSRLDAIAAESDRDAGGVAGIVARDDVTA